MAWLIFAVLIGMIANLNYVSIHRYYRDRLMESFMPDVEEVLKPEGSRPDTSPEADQVRLSEMCPCHAQELHSDSTTLANNNNIKDPVHTPYHIINTNIVLAESKKPKYEGRGGDNFILSPRFCGSNATGWQCTKDFMDNRMTLATAMAISGAAVNPSAGCGGEGITRRPFLSSLMALLNIRLGYWAHNPANPPSRIKTPKFLYPGLSEIFWRKYLNENNNYVELSDGGHFENLGIYELILRRLKIIIVSDAGADPDYAFSDLANVIEKVRVDFGTLIKIKVDDVQVLEPNQGLSEGKEQMMHFADRGYFIAEIDYPGEYTGKLIYLSTTFFKSLSADLYGFKKANKSFPDEPTSDQFFDEKQFEAYRELGYQAASHLIDDPAIKADTVIKRIFNI